MWKSYERSLAIYRAAINQAQQYQGTCWITSVVHALQDRLLLDLLTLDLKEYVSNFANNPQTSVTGHAHDLRSSLLRFPKSVANVANYYKLIQPGKVTAQSGGNMAALFFAFMETSQKSFALVTIGDDITTSGGAEYPNAIYLDIKVGLATWDEISYLTTHFVQKLKLLHPAYDCASSGLLYGSEHVVALRFVDDKIMLISSYNRNTKKDIKEMREEDFRAFGLDGMAGMTMFFVCVRRHSERTAFHEAIRQKIRCVLPLSA